jgi:uncharacterized glyoxalase superfamily protein PhnB
VDSHSSIITLGVRDLEKALSFYRDGLGLSVTSRKGDLVIFDFGDLQFGLYPNPKSVSSSFTTITLSHNVSDNSAVRAMLHSASAAGARIISQPHVATWGGYSGSFADLDGHLWEVACPSNLEPDLPPSA